MNIKKSLRLFDNLYRKCTARKRSLPNFIIIGAQRCGTTSLYRYLTQHPNIRSSTKKEIHYFDVNYQKGLWWYRMHFPLKTSSRENFVTGEASPYYLFHPHVPKRITQVLPKVKLIALLRNPVDRAISNYFNQVKKARETLSFDRAIEDEEERTREELNKLLKHEFYDSVQYRWYSYKKRGIYIDQIKRYHKYFNHDQILILKSEEFFENIYGTLREVFKFLEVNPHFRPKDISARNVVYYNKINKDTYEKLKCYFRPHNERLYEYLNHDFGW
jgi:hypothetical protein